MYSLLFRRFLYLSWTQCIFVWTSSVVIIWCSTCFVEVCLWVLKKYQYNKVWLFVFFPMYCFDWKEFQWFIYLELKGLLNNWLMKSEDIKSIVNTKYFKLNQWNDLWICLYDLKSHLMIFLYVIMEIVNGGRYQNWSIPEKCFWLLNSTTFCCLSYTMIVCRIWRPTSPR